MQLEADAYSMPGPFGIGVLAIRSPIDSNNIRKLEGALEELLQEHRHLIVDLAATSYVSSVGWSTLLVQAGGDRSRIRIAGMSAAVHDVFDLLGLSLVLDVHSTVGEAVTAIIAEVSSDPIHAGHIDDGS
jgi:anti-anti-sigma factor